MRLIDADALLDKQESLYMKGNVLFHGVTAYTIENAPTIDLETLNVREDVHGEWKPTEYPIMPECEDCSVCGYRAVYGHNYKFCPNCGAQMDGGAT